VAFRTVIELDYRGLGQLLESKGVLDDLEARASRIQAAADARGVMVEGIPGNVALPVEVERDETPSRSRVRVVLAHPAGEAVELKHRLLVGSLEAADHG
jgi:hypothetical protein